MASSRPSRENTEEEVACPLVIGCEEFGLVVCESDRPNMRRFNVVARPLMYSADESDARLDDMLTN